MELIASVTEKTQVRDTRNAGGWGGRGGGVTLGVVRQHARLLDDDASPGAAADSGPAEPAGGWGGSRSGGAGRGAGGGGGVAEGPRETLATKKEGKRRGWHREGPREEEEDRLGVEMVQVACLFLFFVFCL
jgi:hypothetical protein